MRLAVMTSAGLENLKANLSGMKISQNRQILCFFFIPSIPLCYGSKTFYLFSIKHNCCVWRKINKKFLKKILCYHIQQFSSSSFESTAWFWPWQCQ
jgi:hypothetical protein